jgi:hypothetical protein
MRTAAQRFGAFVSGIAQLRPPSYSDRALRGEIWGRIVKGLGANPRETNAASHISSGSRSPRAAISISRLAILCCNESGCRLSRISLQALSKASPMKAVVSASKDRSEISTFLGAYRSGSIEGLRARKPLSPSPCFDIAHASRPRAEAKEKKLSGWEATPHTACQRGAVKARWPV